MSLQFLRKYSLLVMRPAAAANNPSAQPSIQEAAIDLSALHFEFKTSNQDDESPSNCSIRVYNVKQDTINQITKDDNFSRVVLQAGYDGSIGVIFDGNIKQFRTGRLNQTDTYLDILAADGDLGYNFAVAGGSVAAGSPKDQIRNVIADAFKDYGVTLGQDLSQTGGTLPRGKVLFGMARTFMRQYAESRGSTWSIQNGQIQIIPLKGYLPNELVELNAATGLIGVPEQTIDGVKVVMLINPRIVIGGLVHINNKLVNQTYQQNPNNAPIPFNQWANPQFLANVSNDGYYRVYVAEHEGDTRGQKWYTNLTCLQVDISSQQVSAHA